MRLYQVDAFTAEAFGGNPAAVVLLEEPRPDAWMQAVAAELNLSETAFVLRAGAGFGLRWFTPAVEVSLCGHATLAAAHVLWQCGELEASEPAVFSTRSGELFARRDGDAIELDLPAYPLREAPVPEAVLALVGGRARGGALLDDLAGDRAWLLELDDEAAVRAFTADDRALLATGHGGLVLTARAAPGGEADIVSRCFFPGAGLSEDPVTGAAHCALAPYWSPRLGVQAFVAHQASVRGGLLGVRHDGDRVRLSGRAITVLRGELLA